MIRQFSTFTFRDRVSDVRNKQVMVVGNPANTPIGFADLPGAEQEGNLVASKFKENGFDVQAAIHTDSSTIMSQMFSKDYRVLHLAGHGVFEYEYKETEEARPEFFTGMVLGEGVFLTASEIRKKANIPELVFINCCHLARISSNKKEVNVPATAYNDFAASLSEELINMGVKAVVAAGWAVDDAAALTFAEEFYDQLFKGRSFGEAVHGARTLTFEMHKDRTNTWGAYQCYGDPEYRLMVQTAGGQARTESFADVEEAILKINQQCEKAKTASAQGIERIKNDLHAMREALEKNHADWMDNAELLDALGEAFGEAFWFEEAVKYYELATGRGKATAAIKAIEQTANLNNRLAVREFEQDPSAYPRSKKRIADQIKKMRQLMNTLVETPERWSIIGGGYKRLAQISAGKDGKACNAALAEMESAYRKAAEKDKSSYPLSNALAANIVRRLRSGKTDKGKLAGLKAEVNEAIAQAEKESKGGRTDFWAKTGVTDARLLENLFKCLGGKGKTFNDKLHDELVNQYNTAWRQFGSARELNSIIEHYAFVAATLKKAKPFDESRESLEKILASLRSMYQGNSSDT
jgi:CHAT domain-containing protein